MRRIVEWGLWTWISALKFIGFALFALVMFPVTMVMLVVWFPIAVLLVIFFPGERWGTKFTRAEVGEHARDLDQWFTDALAESPDGLGVGPTLAGDLARLVDDPQLTHETAKQLAERVDRELKGYKGTPFMALRDLSHRLVELTNEGSDDCRA